jgi:hypothetical protein
MLRAFVGVGGNRHRVGGDQRSCRTSGKENRKGPYGMAKRENPVVWLGRYILLPEAFCRKQNILMSRCRSPPFRHFGASARLEIGFEQDIYIQRAHNGTITHKCLVVFTDDRRAAVVDIEGDRLG